MSYVNKDALARRKARLQAKASANRTVNHEAIKRRAERLKAQQTEEYANDMPKLYMAKPKKRKKLGKISAWKAHMRCTFRKIEDDGLQYIERCAVKVPISDLAKIKREYDLYSAIINWILALQKEKQYQKSIKLEIERWEAVR